YEQPVADADGSAGAGTYETCGLSYVLGGVQSVSGSTVQWSQLSGPGTAVFSSSTIFNPTATADEYGTYVFEMTETRGSCVSSEQVTVTYYEKPIGTNTIEVAACSDVGFNFNAENYITNGVTGNTYNWSAAYGAGLTGGAGSGVNAIAETLTNTTANNISAVYYVTPLSADGCVGDVFAVTV